MRLRRLIFCVVVLLYFIILNVSVQAPHETSLFINEVMVQPYESDHYFEWIELYNPTNKPINVSHWTVYDGQEEDRLLADSLHGNGSTIIPPKQYALITDKGTKVYDKYKVANETLKLCVDDFTIGGYGLNNNKEFIQLNSSTKTIDWVEWGDNYAEIPGDPIRSPPVNISLARYESSTSLSSLLCFFPCLYPSPGAYNQIHINLTINPRYAAKIPHNHHTSPTYSCKITLRNLASTTTYAWSAGLYGQAESSYPASQTWIDSKWAYSRFYHTFTTDKSGSYTRWISLRFNNKYKEYHQHITNNSHAYLKIKIKQNDKTYQITKHCLLLDLDNTTQNAVPAGYVIGTLNSQQYRNQNQPLLLKNTEGAITSCLFTEQNNIADTYPPIAGYYKIPSPLGTDYCLFLLKETTEVLIQTNIAILPGENGVDVTPKLTTTLLPRYRQTTIPLVIKNTGDFSDTYTLSISSNTPAWDTRLSRETLALQKNHHSSITLMIKPPQVPKIRYGNLTVSVSSHNDPGLIKYLDLSFEVLSADLTITKLVCLDDSRNSRSKVGEGEFIRIKAYVKNIGNQNATDVQVNFYADSRSNEKLIGQKTYSSIGRYQKYPSVVWDTLHVPPGVHQILAVVDPDDSIEEFSETNNQAKVELDIIPTSPSELQQSVCITELYYHCHPGLQNEYIAVYNPTRKPVSLAGWYLTHNPWKKAGDQTKIIFPSDVKLSAQSTLYVTQNASAYLFETGEYPDFEYACDSNACVPQMSTCKTFQMSNTKGLICLKDAYNHSIDTVAYGSITQTCPGWIGPPVPKSGEGRVVKRNIQNNLPCDSNSSSDWQNPRVYGIGQSDFSLHTITFFGNVTCFVSPDCSFQAITEEIKKANRSLYLNIYEFTSPLLLDAILDALKRNISVYIYHEGSPIGGIDHRQALILYKIACHGGIVRCIVSDAENRVHARYRFNHAKYLIIDNKTVIVESCNWVKTGIPQHPTFGNREWGIIIHNKSVAQLFLNIYFDDADIDRCDTYSFQQLNLSVPNDFFLNRNSYSGAYTPQCKPSTILGNISATPLFSPDNSEQALLDLLQSAQKSIYIEQLYIYPNWTSQQSPFVTKLINKAEKGLDVRIILNCNPGFDDSYKDACYLKSLLQPHGIQVKLLYTNWSYFVNMHNKGVVIDNHTVLISSVNWNENSVRNNREAGVIITNPDVAAYYLQVFLFDWTLEEPQSSPLAVNIMDYKSNILLVVIYSVTFGIIARDWRKRSWNL